MTKLSAIDNSGKTSGTYTTHVLKTEMWLPTKTSTLPWLIP